MKLLEEAKRLFNGDDKSLQNIPEAFQRLDSLIEEEDTDAIKLKLDFLHELGDKAIAISHMDVEFENNRPAEGYADTDLNRYCEKGSYLAIKEKIQRLDSNDTSSCTLKNALALMIAQPIVALHEKLFRLGEANYGYTLATLYFNGKHKDYPQINFAPDIEKGINCLFQATLQKHRPSIIELMKIYVGVPSHVLTDNALQNPLIEFKNVNEAQNLYNYTCVTIDERDEENTDFFTTLCTLIKSIATSPLPRSYEDELLFDLETISTLVEHNHLTSARDLLEKVKTAAANKAYPLDEHIGARLHALEMILQAISDESEEVLVFPKQCSVQNQEAYFHHRYNPSFFEPISSSSSYLSTPESRFAQRYFPHSAIHHSEVNPQSNTSSITITQKTSDNTMTPYYIDIIFGDGFIPIDNIVLLKAFFENMGTKDAKTIASEMVNCLSCEKHQQFRIGFNPRNEDAMLMFRSLKTFINEVFNQTLTESNENTHETAKRKGKEKVGIAFL